MIVFTIIGVIFVIFIIAGFFSESACSQNDKFWESFYEIIKSSQDPHIIELRSAVHSFFIPDKIDFFKFQRNMRAFEVLDEYGSYEIWIKINNLSINPEPPLNPTISFLKFDHILDRAIAIPYWFYIVYPDVALWFGEKQKIPHYDEVMFRKYGNNFNVKEIIKDLIYEYKSKGTTLETTI